MKLAAHTEYIRQLIDKAFRNQLGRLGIAETPKTTPSTTEATTEQLHLQGLLAVFTKELGKHQAAFEKLIEELTFTLFNRLAALKVMEAHVLHPEIVTRRSTHGDRSFAHLVWLETHPEARTQDAEGIVPFFEAKFGELAADIPLFSPQHPFHLLPTAIELMRIIHAFNAVEEDNDVATDIWKSDDVLGWLYESYNNYKKAAHKASKQKTEYNKVSIQSQVYTPRWVVKFLVDNSLGKCYLEMFPDSEIKQKYKIANAPNSPTREAKPLHEIRLIDPATGSGNFLLYAFDLFYDLYLDQIEEYDADYNERDIPKLIIENNLHGVDLDDRAIQLAQLGLYIKAKRKRNNKKITHFNIVSSDFFLPDYSEVQAIFENNNLVGDRERSIIADIWDDLQNAHKFGSLVRLEEKMSVRWFGTKQQSNTNQITMFDNSNIEDYATFKTNFFANLQKAISQHTSSKGQNFLNTKTKDAITFLQLLTQKYDIATANPPYTNSSDFGGKLKKFIEANYKKPYGFNTNLYASFINRCYELTTDDGYIGMIHPHTFMFIKTFKGVREYLINKTHIDLMVDYGLDRVNLFGPGILLDATWYVLSKKRKTEKGIYFNITANQQEKYKKQSLEQAYDDTINQKENNRVHQLTQEKLKTIDGMPFIYWISDGFREKFEEGTLDEYFFICNGISSGGNNERFFRYIWEVNQNDISIDYSIDNKKWVIINKGGGFNKWYGNLWLLFEWEDNGKQLKELKKTVHSIRYGYEEFYFKEGLTFTGASSKGVSVRYQPRNCIFERAGKSMFKKQENVNYLTALSYLNSKLIGYVIDALNPTVNVQAGDIKRLPFILPPTYIEIQVEQLAQRNINIKKHRCTYSLIETNFEKSPLLAFSGNSLTERVKAYFDDENTALTEVLLNEAIINELIFEVYELSISDRAQVENKMGRSIGALPVAADALAAYQSIIEAQDAITKADVLEHLQNLAVIDFDETVISSIQVDFKTLYQSNNDLEEFCIAYQVNPINVWYWFKNSRTLPKARMADIALEFLADSIRALLTEDEDGIIPLVGLPNEPKLSDRLEQYCLRTLGFSAAQYMQLDQLLGRPLNDYLEQHFFKALSDHLNLFMYLPKTPFIWHLSSGKHQGIEVFALIYKWNRDSLFKLKSQYIAHRRENLEYRQIQLQGVETAQAQNEREEIDYQLDEIKGFETKIDELIAEDYHPKLDDGVGKNIAPLQQKELLKAEVLKKKQLEKYLNADW